MKRHPGGIIFRPQGIGYNIHMETKDHSGSLWALRQALGPGLTLCGKACSSYHPRLQTCFPARRSSGLPYLPYMATHPIPPEGAGIQLTLWSRGESGRKSPSPPETLLPRRLLDALPPPPWEAVVGSKPCSSLAHSDSGFPEKASSPAAQPCNCQEAPVCVWG